MTQPPQGPPSVLVSTMNDLPGYQVVRVYGEIFGLTVRSRNVFANIGAGFKSLAGGEIRQYTKMISDSRHEAINRLREAAAGFGANAVLAMRFDCNEIANTMSEIAAYGTAVYVVPVQQPSQPTYQAAPQAPAPQAPPPQHAPPPAPAQGPAPAGGGHRSEPVTPSTAQPAQPAQPPAAPTA